MKNKRHSIKDIAKTVGTSITTVSFVLNGKAKEKKISKAVTKKILDYIKEINYKPNLIAQSLRTGKSNIIVFMVEDISNYFFAKLSRIIEDLAYKKGYKVLFCSNENDDEKSIELINLFKKRGVDGYIIVPSVGIESKIKELIDEDIPVVLFDRYFNNLKSHQVIVNNKEASFEATQHLIGNKYRHIGFIYIDVKQTQMIDRFEGYKQAVSSNALQSFTLKIPLSEINKDDGEALIEKFLKENIHLDAIYFATNYLAINGLKVIKKSFPHYLNKKGLIVFDNIDFFSIYSPTISAVSQPLPEIANQLISIIFSQIKDNEKSPKQITLKTNLIIRESSQNKL